MARYARAIAAAAALALGLTASPARLSGQNRNEGGWITAWSTSHHALGTTTISNATVRLIARVDASGSALRIRLDNPFGSAPLTIASAYVGSRKQGAVLIPGSNRQVLFGAAAGVTIPVGGSVASDPVNMPVTAGQDLAVSLYVPALDVKPSQHTLGFTTSYLSAPASGNVAADEGREAFTETTTSLFWLKAIDIRGSSSPGTIVAFGDSITDGNCSTVDGHDRWVDWLSVQLDMVDGAAGKSRKAVINEGISGNTIGRQGLQPPPDSPPGLERLDRDVLSHQGVTDVIVFMATNDIRRESTAAQVIAGLSEITARIKARGPRVIGVTIIPRHNNTTNSPWDAKKSAIRREVNQWIRQRAPFDGVIDFDAVVRDPADADRIRPVFNCDEIHPTPLGYYEMGRSVPLSLFRR